MAISKYDTACSTHGYSDTQTTKAFDVHVLGLVRGFFFGCLWEFSCFSQSEDMGE